LGFISRSSNDQDAGRHSIAHRAVRASSALLLRQLFVYGSNIVGSVVLARTLPASQYGFYGIILFSVAFLGIFGGTGFASSLIISREKPALEDMRVLFTGQQLIVLGLFLVIWLLSPSLAATYHMGLDGRWFFRMIGGALVLTSFMVIPQILLERELAFDRLAIIEVTQAIVFNSSAIILAKVGYGALSFSVALVARAFVGAALANTIMPWRIGVRCKFSTLFRHLQFGAALQAGQFVGMLKDSISPLFVGVFLGATEVGYVTWATSLTAYAVWVLMPLQRLYLPLFARFGDDAIGLSRAITYALWVANAIAAPLTLVTLALSHPITELVFGKKWFVALPLYYMFAFGNLLIPCSTPLMGALNALGKSKYTLLISSMWMLTTWALGVPCVLMFGVKGFGVAMIGVQLTNLVLFWLAWKKLKVNPFLAYWPSWGLALCMGGLLLLAQVIFPVVGIMQLTSYGIGALLVYGAALWVLYPKRTRPLLQLLRESV
jgi:O-antigen/teichoic acid export membrane protein